MNNRKLLIVCNYERRELVLTPEPIEKDFKEVSIYEAEMYVQKLGFKWKGNSIRLKDWIKQFGIPEWDRYQFTMVVPSGISNDDLDRCYNKYVDKYLGPPDYILQLENGAIELTHSTGDINYLKNNGYYINEETYKNCTNHSMGIGLYAYDLEKVKDELETFSDDTYIGEYTGYYFRCIEDVQNAEKDGKEFSSQQELLFPYDTETIIWRGVSDINKLDLLNWG